MKRPLKILIAPSGFKESLSPIEAAQCMARGLSRVWPDAELRLAPIADGGEGFAETIVAALGGVIRTITVSGPLGEPVAARYGRVGEAGAQTALIDVASAAGLSLIPRNRRDPALTSSRGVGQLMRAALDDGARHLLIGCGDSGVHDAGMGLARELGVRFLDASGDDLGEGGAQLARLARLDLSGLAPRLRGVSIEAAVNWDNLLLGERGVTRRHAAQKGATPSQVAELERAFETFDRILSAALGRSIAHDPGSGASGGIGAALIAFAGATLHPRQAILHRYLDIDGLLNDVDIVFTGEGALDGQTVFGKVPCQIAQIAAEHGIPTVAVAGMLGADAAVTLGHGIRAYTSIIERPCEIDVALCDASGLLERATARAARLMDVGLQIGSRQAVVAKRSHRIFRRRATGAAICH